jgi:hypothetical protein
MMTKVEPDPRTQAEKFANLARELECDESEEAFDERLKQLARAPKAIATDHDNK